MCLALATTEHLLHVVLWPGTEGLAYAVPGKESSVWGCAGRDSLRHLHPVSCPIAGVQPAQCLGTGWGKVCELGTRT